MLNSLTATIGRPFFGQKLRAARARELFKPYTDSASLIVEIEKNVFVFGLAFSLVMYLNQKYVLKLLFLKSTAYIFAGI